MLSVLSRPESKVPEARIYFQGQWFYPCFDHPTTRHTLIGRATGDYTGIEYIYSIQKHLQYGIPIRQEQFQALVS